MGIVELLLTALALSMDAFAVSVSNSMCYPGITPRQQTGAAVSFGLFQGLMPTLGFFAGSLFAGLIRGIDHWLALVLLGFIGGKMLVEGLRALRAGGGECEAGGGAVFTLRILAVQSVATSIDALAVGIGFAALGVNILASASVIAVTTFVCCLLGNTLGRRFGLVLGDRAQVLGGAILVAIGLKIFVEHMFFGG